MTRPSLILGISAAFVLSLLPLAASAGAAYSSHHRPAQWQRAHDGQGVMRVYGGDLYRAPEAYTGGDFRGGLDVQTAHDYADYRDQDYRETRYADEYYQESGRYTPLVPSPCRSVCVTADVPPPPPPCATEVRREVRYAAPRVVSRAVMVEDEESREYYRSSSRGYEDRRYDARRDDCPCHGDHYRDAEYDDRYDDRYGGHGQDVFGRY